MNVLVTGGAGFVGSHLIDALVRRGDAVTVLDDLSTGCTDNLRDAMACGSVDLVEGATCDAELVDELVAACDCCFHLASAVGVQLIVDQAYESLIRNVRGCDTVLHAAQRHDKRVLYTSTSEVYGKHSDGSLHETSDRLLGPPQLSRWSYAIAKGFGESLAFSLAREMDAEAVVVRLFNTVGPRQTGFYGMVLPNFVSQALAGKEITVYGDGSQSRCFAHVNDTVRALLELIDHDDAIGNVYNVGACTETTILELARLVLERTGSASAIAHVPFEEAYGEGFEELGRRQPDTTNLRELTGWEPELTVVDAIDDVVAYMRQEAVLVDAEQSLAGEAALE